MRPITNTTIAALGIGISSLVFCIKMVAYYVSDSVALQADATESIINIIAAVCGTVALWYSSKPADKNHHYGHYKIEYLAATAEGVLILFTAFAIGYSVIHNFKNPHELKLPFIGVMINLLGTGVNLAWALLLLKLGRVNKSPALVSSGRHTLSDVWTGLSLALGVLLIPLTHWTVLDEVLGSIVVLLIVKSGWDVVCESIAGLTDEAPSYEILKRIESVIKESGAGALEAHHIRTRVVGPMTFLDFHLVVPNNMRVVEAHSICDRIEKDLKDVIGDTSVSIHVEPETCLEHSGVKISV